MLHALEDFFLDRGEIPEFFAQQETAVSVESGEGGTEVMDGAGEEIGALLIVLLKPEVGLNEALEQLVAVGAQRIDVAGQDLGTMETLDGLVKECPEGSPGDRLEDQVHFGKILGAKQGNVFPLHEDHMTAPLTRFEIGQFHVRGVVPDAQIESDGDLTVRKRCEDPTGSQNFAENFATDSLQLLVG